MGKVYSYGPLKSSYLSNYEKIWIEGYCKENKIILTESNLTKTLIELMDKCPDSVDEKIHNLVKESGNFSAYTKSIASKSWNNILGYMMKCVQPIGVLTEAQIKPMIETNYWWRNTALKILSEELAESYFNAIILECMSADELILEKIKSFNPGKANNLMETAKKLFSYEKIKLAYPEKNINDKEILQSEPGLNLFPNPKSILNMISWTAETTKLVNKK